MPADLLVVRVDGIAHFRVHEFHTQLCGHALRKLADTLLDRRRCHRPLRSKNRLTPKIKSGREPTDANAALRTRDELYGHAGQKGKSGRAIKMARQRWANYWENGAIIQGSGALTQGDRRAADCGNGISLIAATVCRLLR